ncbi:MAG: AAA family ATPase [Hyphomicrobiales bacterium]|nr:AAA family ATPase [Hyphomicrobiales bacterium]
MIVFVAGLSKSGKTSRSKHAADNVADLEYVSVSQLIRDAGRDLAVTTIADALENQRFATAALRAMPVRKPHLLVDGHALIETGEGPMLVPDLFFDELRPSAILIVCACPEDILSRRSYPAGRVQIKEIATLTMLEEVACERAAFRLGIPVITLMAPSLEEFSETLRRQLIKN